MGSTNLVFMAEGIVEEIIDTNNTNITGITNNTNNTNNTNEVSHK